MKTDVVGRVRNTSVAASRPLLPLYEAVVNSIQAIQDAGADPGRITIEIIRDDHHLLREQDPLFGDITGFDISDNGVGFDNANYGAFQTSDTTFKEQRGGKGVGRFLWLVAFERAEIVSDFAPGKEDGQRSFEFVAEGDGIRNMVLRRSEAKARQTVVRLRGFLGKYQAQCPKKMDTIAAHLIEYCLEYFILADCPEILIRESSTGDESNLNERFDDEIAAQSVRDRVQAGEHQLNVLHVRRYASSERDHRLNFCANNRVVTSERVAGRIPNTSRRFTDNDGNEFLYAGYVDGTLLDETVNAERTEFAIPQDSSELLTESVTWDQIRNAVLESTAEFLSPYTAPIREAKKERVQRFVATEAPQYRPILRHISDELDGIDPDANDDELDLELYKAYQAVDLQSRREGQELLLYGVPDTDWEAFRERFNEYYEKASDIHKSDLARYVVHRRTVIDFLQKQLTLDGGKYQREDRIHQIIFPQRKTSDEVPIDEHNLWVLDEKLVYHAFLASDKPLRTVEPVDVESTKRPDILLFNTACAFAPEGDPPFPAILVIEFKRPMRDDHTVEENPISQVLEYVQLIREGRVRTHDGRDIPLAKDIPFFCYVVADFTKSLTQQAALWNLDPKPGAQGFFGYHKQYNAYIEVLSYNQVVLDAKQRNAAFFRRLGIPDR